MSDISINICTSQETTQNNPSTKKKRWFRRKLQYLEKKGFLKKKRKHQQGHPRFDNTQHQNGTDYPTSPTSTQDEIVRCPATASQCTPRPSASTHSKPSLTVTVTNSSSHEKPNAQSAVPGPSGSSSCKPVASSAGFPTKYLAIDCEMVGTGPKGSISQLARCSIVSYDGDVVYDKFINPSMPVTDYRTRWSGIRQRDLVKATPFSQAKKEILKLLMGKVVIGHAIHNDFKALSYSHPAVLTRDTSRIPLLNLKAGFAETEVASLKRLTKAIFNRDIQTGKKGHSSVEDAKATMELYKVVEVEWERKLAANSHAS